MSLKALSAEPYNIIITGVGGQGNVLASRLLGQIMTREGYWATIGETFGASQRGGSVMSHLRISSQSAWSPQIPRGMAHFVISLEPSETFRVLAAYGNPSTKVIWNTRPIQPMSVIAGDAAYPSHEDVVKGLDQISAKHWPLEATSHAQKLGNPILGNIMMIGALSAVSELPINKELFEDALGQMMPASKIPINLQAFDLGREEILKLNGAA
jgi:indolepyruvate ferredoxin oxidoreductase beta subunit